MDTEALKAAQRPLKAQYREDPSAALVTLRAEGSLDPADVACSVETGRALVAAGLHPASGGDGALACSGDMLLQALSACAGVTMRAVATSRGLAVEGQVIAEGDLDFRGTLGVDAAVPVGFTSIRLRFEVVSSATPEALEELLELTRRYCVVLQTIVAAPELEVTLTRR